MTVEEVKEKVLTSEDYAEVRALPLVLLSLGGSWAYGTNNDNSDIDVRGCMAEPPTALFGLSPFEQKEIHIAERDVDVVVYAFRKIARLLLENNPNCIEILCTNPRNIIYKTEIADILLENRHLFLSQRSAQSFGGYAKAQLDRIENAMARDRYDQEMVERHMLNSILGMIKTMNTRYKELPEGSLTLEIVDSDKPELEKEIVVNCHLDKYPLRDFKGIWSDLQNVVKDYAKLNNRNRKKDDNHMNKHAMHLCRLLLMGIDILEKEEIITYRENDLDLLLSIRHGDYMNEEGKFKPEFYALVDKLWQRFNSAASTTRLPAKPNFHKVENLIINLNKRLVEQFGR